MRDARARGAAAISFVAAGLVASCGTLLETSSDPPIETPAQKDGSSTDALANDAADDRIGADAPSDVHASDAPADTTTNDACASGVKKCSPEVPCCPGVNIVCKSNALCGQCVPTRSVLQCNGKADCCDPKADCAAGNGGDQCCLPSGQPCNMGSGLANDGCCDGLACRAGTCS